MVKKFKTPVSESDHTLGPLNAPVVLVEYGDFECPYSGAAATVIEQLLSEYPRELYFVFRHFPLKGIHPTSEMAALASEAAHEQNQFWNMYHLLFDNQEHLSLKFIEMLARKLRLDMSQFMQDIKRLDLMEKVQRDYQVGIKSGVESTPSFYINDIKFEGSSSYSPLREAIENELRGRGSLHA